jgi:hypothetical protein
LELSDSKERREMAIGLIIDWPAGTQRQYDALMDELKFEGTLPSGELLHAAGPSAPGWRIVDIWETRADFDRFLEQKLAAALQKIGVSDPQVTEFPIHNMLR